MMYAREEIADPTERPRISARLAIPRLFGRALLKVMLAVAAAGSLALPAAAAGLQRFALVVGASGYANPITPLEGPRNDVTLLVNTLIETQWAKRDHLRVLADDLAASYYQDKVSADGQPTIAEIRKGLTWLVNVAGPEDELIIYLSGHGSYVPAKGLPGEAPESDGVDEIFLPLDIGRWSDTLHGVENQLSDNEIGAYLAKIRAKGAKVWLIADSCNSGSLSRQGIAVRSVDPIARLGVSRGAFNPRARAYSPRVRELASPKPGGNGFVGFYAAHPSLDAIEARVPLSGSQSQSRVHGVFTWYLIRAIRSGQTATFERIAHTIISGYSEWQGAAPVPMFDGDLRVATGFASLAGRLYSLTTSGAQLLVRAGMLDGIDAGTRFNLVDLRGDVPKTVALGRATTSAPDRTVIEVLPAVPPVTETVLKELRSVPHAFAAEVTSLGVSLGLSVALDPMTNGTSAPDQQTHARTASALAALFAAPPKNQMIALIPASTPGSADVRLIVKAGRVWLAPPTGETVLPNGSEPPSLAGLDISSASLGRLLAQIGHGRNLLKAAYLIENTQIAQSVQATLLRTAQKRRQGRCPSEVPAPAEPRGLNVFESKAAKHRPASLADCDFVTIVVNNQNRRAIGVTPLYVDAWFRIDFLYNYEGSSYSSLIIDPGQSGVIAYTESVPGGPQAKRSGRGNIVLLITPVSGTEPIAPDFRALDTDTSSALRADALDSSSADFLLHAAGAGGGAYRSATADSETNVGAITIPVYLATPRKKP